MTGSLSALFLILQRLSPIQIVVWGSNRANNLGLGYAGLSTGPKMCALFRGRLKPVPPNSSAHSEALVWMPNI
jgi:hypothetical protein